MQIIIFSIARKLLPFRDLVNCGNLLIHNGSINIKKTMCHHTLKGVVCDRHSFFGCSRNNSILKDGVFVKFLDIISDII